MNGTMACIAEQDGSGNSVCTASRRKSYRIKGFAPASCRALDNFWGIDVHSYNLFPRRLTSVTVVYRPVIESRGNGCRYITPSRSRCCRWLPSTKGHIRGSQTKALEFCRVTHTGSSVVSRPHHSNCCAEWTRYSEWHSRLPRKCGHIVGRSYFRGQANFKSKWQRLSL